MIALGELQSTDANEAVRADLRRRRAQGTTTLRRRLERAVREGELPRGLDCRSVARFYATVQHGMSIQARDGASREALLSIADCAMAAWDRLVGDDLGDDVGEREVSLPIALPAHPQPLVVQDEVVQPERQDLHRAEPAKEQQVDDRDVAVPADPAQESGDLVHRERFDHTLRLFDAELAPCHALALVDPE